MRVIIEVKGGALYGVIADGPLDVTVLDHDVCEAGTWEVDVDPKYVQANWVDDY